MSNVAIMGYVNSVAHVQREHDFMLKDCRDFLRAYVDDLPV